MTPPDTAALRPERALAPVRLRPTVLSDLGYVLTLEQEPDNLPFITPWDRTQHEGAIRFPDFRHFIIEGGEGFEPLGYLILIGCRSPHQTLELKRMVVQRQGEGFGRATLRAAKKVAFDELRAHRLWLDVRTHNTRARSLYDSEGFVAEGVLREAVRLGDGSRDSLVLMAMLHTEFATRRREGLELPA